MTDPNIPTSNTADAGMRVAGAPVATTRPHLYIAIVLLAVLGTYGYQFKKDSIFACPATGYAADRYLAYCQADHYGDYEHGAFWFGLEPEVRESLAAAQVMFMGNSRLQWGFSNRTTSDWFASIRASYYLIGFSYYETYKFEASLLRQVSPRARVYVINIDGFFKPEESVPAQSVMHDAKYECGRVCDDIFRDIFPGFNQRRTCTGQLYQVSAKLSVHLHAEFRRVHCGLPQRRSDR